MAQVRITLIFDVDDDSLKNKQTSDFINGIKKELEEKTEIQSKIEKDLGCKIDNIFSGLIIV